MSVPSVVHSATTAAASLDVQAHVEIEPGVHRVAGTAPFGLYVSGLATYTSYYIPGGMDFEPITPPF